MFFPLQFPILNTSHIIIFLYVSILSPIRAAAPYFVTLLTHSCIKNYIDRLRYTACSETFGFQIHLKLLLYAIILQQISKQLYRNMYTISHNSIYPTLSCHKYWSPFCTNSSVCSKLWNWTVPKYKLYILQSTINNSHYHPNTHHNVLLP